MYRVIKIIDEYTLVVNYGKKNGARKGKILEIYETGDEIIDPETNESLGTLDFIKASISVLNVYDNMSLCESNEYKTKTVPNAISAYLETTKEVTEQLSLKVNTEQVTGGYRKNKTINVGDLVREAF